MMGGRCTEYAEEDTPIDVYGDPGAPDPAEEWPNPSEAVP
jgi:hypothetical protein